MSAIETYIGELARGLHVRGAPRQRFLRECRDHLEDATADGCDERAAVEAFGPAAEIAAAFDAEVAARRGVHATLAAVLGVAATAVSTLAIVDGAAAGAVAPTLWAVVFFVAAQTAGVAGALALAQAAAMRRRLRPAAELALLTRRNVVALAASGVTMFAAGAGLPGQGSAPLLMLGPLLACAALATVLRARRLTRRMDGARTAAVRSPLEDLTAMTGLPLARFGLERLALAATGVAAVAAFAWDRGERAGVGHALLVAGVEVAAVALGWLALGPALGLRRRASAGTG